MNKEDIEKGIKLIIISKEIKYICLTAIYIDRSIIDKIFGDIDKIFAYIMSSDLFTEEEKLQIKKDLYDDELEDIENKINNNLEKLVLDMYK